MALIGAAMANKGTVNGVTVLGQKGWDALHADPITRPTFFNITTSFTQGGVDLAQATPADKKDNYKPLPGTEGFYGWMGYGGSVFQVNIHIYYFVKIIYLRIYYCLL